MKITFDRTAYLNETSVLTNFEKKYEVPEDTPVGALITKFLNQHLKLELPEELDNWRILAIRNMAFREVASIGKGARVWVNEPQTAIAEFLGTKEPVTLLAIHQKTVPVHPEASELKETAAAQAQDEAQGKKSPSRIVQSSNSQAEETGGGADLPQLPAAPEDSGLAKEAASDAAKLPVAKWQTLLLPIRVETKVRQFLALGSGVLSVASVGLLIWQYQMHKAIMTEAIISAIAFGLGFYYLLLNGRRIIFWTKSVIYRNRYNQYEKFRVNQFEHVEWVNHSDHIKFVFRYEEKGRNFISAASEKYLELIVWAVSNGIPIYSTDREKKRI